MKKGIFKILEIKKISRQKLLNLHAGNNRNGGVDIKNGSTTTCGDEPENKLSLEYVLWLNCIKSNDPRGGTEFCAFA